MINSKQNFGGIPMKKQSPNLPRYDKAPDESGAVMAAGDLRRLNLGASQPANRSGTIPLPSSHIHRTQSELQLCEEMANAERRDLTMFYRLINGIRDRQTLARRNETLSTRPTSSLESERSIAMIINARNTPLGRTSYMLETIRSTGGYDAYASPQNNLLLQPPMPSYLNQDQLTTCDRTDVDHWSVSGFEETETSYIHPNVEYQQVPLPEITTEDEEDEIFSLDL
jgi:hypothetical protein